MNLLDIHFRSDQQFAFSGKTRTVANVDHCRCGDGLLTGYHRDGRLILRVALTSVDWFEVRESASLSFPRVSGARGIPDTDTAERRRGTPYAAATRGGDKPEVIH